MAADWHELVVPRQGMQPSIARDPWRSMTDIPSPQSAALAEVRITQSKCIVLTNIAKGSETPLHNQYSKILSQSDTSSQLETFVGRCRRFAFCLVVESYTLVFEAFLMASSTLAFILAVRELLFTGDTLVTGTD